MDFHTCLCGGGSLLCTLSGAPYSGNTLISFWSVFPPLPTFTPSPPPPPAPSCLPPPLGQQQSAGWSAQRPLFSAPLSPSMYVVLRSQRFLSRGAKRNHPSCAHRFKRAAAPF